MNFQTSTGNSSSPTALPFFIFLSAFLNSSPLTQFTSSLTTYASSVLGSLSFSSFISFSKHSFHLFNNASEFIITLPFSSFKTLTCCITFPAPFLFLANLCICGPRESLRQGFKRTAVVLYEKIRNSGKVCATCTGYVRRKRNSDEVCNRNYRN